MISNTSGTMTAAKRISSQLTPLTPVWKASGTSSRMARRSATAPKQVCAPVATTRAVAVPETTLVPMKSRLGCAMTSASPGRASANFSTGSDSPVSAACATKRSRAASTRQSAGTMSPAARWTRSPGTSSRSGMSCGGGGPGAGELAVTRRSTLARLPTRAFSRSTARPERPSCTKRMPVLRATMATMTSAEAAPSVNAETPASADSSRLKGSL